MSKKRRISGRCVKFERSSLVQESILAIDFDFKNSATSLASDNLFEQMSRLIPIKSKHLFRDSVDNEP